MAMGPDGPSSYYSTLGLPPHASASDIRSAYRRLAMQWHPDKFSGGSTEKGEFAKRKFQEIQEAYHVLSDEGKRALYDVHMYDPTEGDEDIEGLSSFIREMSVMMAQVKEEDKNQSIEDLQKLFFQTFREDLESWNMSSPACNGGFSQQAHRLQEDQEPDDDPQDHPHHMKKNRWEVDSSQSAYQDVSRRCHSQSTVKLGHSHNSSSRDCSHNSKHRKRRGSRTPSTAPSMPPVVSVAAATTTGSSPATIDNYSYSFMHFFCPPLNGSFTFLQ